MYQELVNKFLENCTNNRLSVNTVSAYEDALRVAGEDLGIRKLRDFTNDKIKTWVAMQSDANRSRSGKILKGQTINARISHLRCFLNWCEDEGYKHKVTVRRMPSLKTTQPNRQYWDKKTYFTVMNKANLRDKVMLAILFDSMMRRFEIAKLRLAEIDGRELKYIGKGSKSCVAFINPNTRALLDEYIEKYEITDYIFPKPERFDRPVGPETIARRYKRCFERCGIRGAHTHSSRHTGATDLELNNAPMRLISKCMNHSNIVTTEIYTHAFEDRMLLERDKYKSVLSF